MKCETCPSILRTPDFLIASSKSDREEVPEWNQICKGEGYINHKKTQQSHNAWKKICNTLYFHANLEKKIFRMFLNNIIHLPKPGVRCQKLECQDSIGL